MAKLTKWEAGQALIYCADELWDQERDLRDGGYIELANVVRDCRLMIGDRFNAHGSHDFGLACSAPAPKRPRKKGRKS